MKRSCLIVFFLFSIVFAACGLLVDQGRQVLATVGDEPIRLEELLVRIRTLPFEQRARTNDPDPALRLQSRRSLLDEIIEEKLLLQEAKARNIEITAEEVDAALIQREHAEEASVHVEIDGNMGGPAKHEHKQGEEKHSRREEKNMRLELMVQKMLGSELNEAARRRYYDLHPEEFAVVPPQVILEMLVVEDSQEDLLNQIVENYGSGADTLVEAASLFEKPPTLVFCGEMPPAPVELLVPEIKKKVKNLSIGQISEPFPFNPQTEKQIAVARMVRTIDKIPYENGRDIVQKKLYDSFLQELREKYEVVVDEERLDYRLPD